MATNYPLWALVNQAYNVTSKQVEKLPTWAQNARFDIRARSGSSTSRAEMLDMLRSLLEDRFQLKVRRETRVVDAYVLAIDRQKYPGPGLHPVSVDCAANTVSPNSKAGLFAPDERPPCGSVVLKRTPKRTTTDVRYRYAGFEFTQFVSALEANLTRPTKDRTGLSGVYDIELTYSVPLSPDVDGPTGWGQAALNDALVRDALKGQLGLALTAAHEPADFLLVESIAMPSPD